jgi:eukaryotic-like serine/threonine-protein kinase
MDDGQERDEIQQKLEAALAGRYAIERPLGEGGMAFVYLAQDVKHERQVAIKVLKPELAASLGAERFLREIQITAKLQHPHILPLYDSGEADGALYYIMPFVLGESLSDQIGREQQLSIHDAVQIAREVAEALAYAHSYGLIHRDIKPDNVMMSNGHAIVADFGIARAMSAAGADKLTQTGMAVGTPAYMSPEQAAGESNVDGRADIYSLGCVFYEMLVGQVPFTGPNAIAIMARHSMDNVTAPSIMRSSIPPEVEDIIFRSMEKLPADRYRTATEMVEALKAIERGEVSVPAARASQMGMRQSQIGMRASQMNMRASRMGMRQSQMGLEAMDLEAAPRRRWPLFAGVGGAAVVVLGAVGWLAFGRGGGARPVVGGLDPRDVAVLYFEDLSSDSALGPVADGITEGLIDQLSAVEGLQVRSRNAVAPFRGATTGRDSIARVLSTGTVVVGSVEPAAGGALRVSARLVDGNSGVDLERSSFQVPGTDLLAARDSVVGTVAGFLRQRIGAEVRVRELQAGTRNTDAWTLLQRGTRLRAEAGRERTVEAQLASLAQADSLLRLSATADPSWPRPMVERGWVAQHRARLERGRAAIPFFNQAIGLADSVLARTPNSAEALELRGTARFHYYLATLAEDLGAADRLKTGARDDLLAAVEQAPNLATAHLTLSQLWYYFDDVGASLLSAQRAYAADAYLENAGSTLNQIFFGLLDQEQFGQAETWCARGTARFPADTRFVICQLFLLVTPGFPPDVPRARQLRARLDTLEAPTDVLAKADILVGGILARAGFVDSARELWTRTRATVTPEVDAREGLSALEAYARTLAGDRDEAIDLLKRAVAANPNHDFAGTAGRYWWWRELRQYERWRREISGR